MKITALEPIVLSIPFSHDGPPSGFGGTTWSSANYLLVRIDTDEGLSGYGEAFGYGAIPGTRAILLEMIKPLVIGKQADDIAGLMAGLKRTLHPFGRSGPVQYALSGLDIALWDLAGKAVQQPVHRLLGASGRAGIKAYASKLRLSEPAAIADACQKAVADGFTGIKLHEHTVDAVAAAREAVGSDVALMVDTNCAWSCQQAIEAGQRMSDFELEWLEEPVWPPEDLESLLRVRDAVRIPVATGENVPNAWGFNSLLQSGGPDLLQPSVTKMGGISEFLEVGTDAASKGRVLAPHSPYFGPGLLATLQLAAIFPTTDWIEYFSVRLEQPIFGGIETPGSDGSIAIPTGPGLGADPDPEILKRYQLR